MASASEIKVRINSVSETKKVTDAMYMISSVKMRKAKTEIENVRPYFNALREEIGELLHYIPENKNRYYQILDNDGNKIGFVKDVLQTTGSVDTLEIKTSENTKSFDNATSIGLDADLTKQINKGTNSVTLNADPTLSAIIDTKMTQYYAAINASAKPKH